MSGKQIVERSRTGGDEAGDPLARELARVFRPPNPLLTFFALWLFLGFCFYFIDALARNDGGWPPADDLYTCGGLALLFSAVAVLIPHLHFGGKAEQVTRALRGGVVTYRPLGDGALEIREGQGEHALPLVKLDGGRVPLFEEVHRRHGFSGAETREMFRRLEAEEAAFRRELREGKLR